MIETLPIQTKSVAQSRIEGFDFTNIPFGKHFADHMFMADYRDGQWTDLQILPYGELPLVPSLSALHYGQAFFEGMKAYKTPSGGVNLFRPLENWKRMNASAERLAMPALPEDLFMSALTSLIALDRDWVPSGSGTSLYIRPFMFATDEFVGVRPSNTYKFMIITSPAGPYYSEPLRVKIETHFTRAAAGGMGYAKAAGNYAAAMYPTQLAQKEGYQQVIWTDGQQHKYIEESGTMNVLFVIDGALITAPTTDSILKGVTRDSVLQLGRDWGMPVEEYRLSVDELMSAIRKGTLQEAFGAGTAATIAQIATIGHEGTDYNLPPVAERKFSTRVTQALDDIKTGRSEDRHGWVFPV